MSIPDVILMHLGRRWADPYAVAAKVCAAMRPAPKLRAVRATMSRMEREGWIEGRWRQSPSSPCVNRRQYRRAP